MIVVTGATGNVGRRIVESLAAAGEEVTAVSRRVTPSDVPPGVRVLATDLASLSITADKLFVLTSGDFVGAGGDLASVMRRVRVGQVVLLSSQGVATGHHAPVLEEAVRDVPWTILRPTGFHSNTLQWSPSIRATRQAQAPFGDVPRPTVDPADIAAMAVAALLNPGHEGKAYELTGPAALTPREQVSAIAKAIGEPIDFVSLTREAAKSSMLAYMPEEIAENTLTLLSDPSPRLRRISPDVETVLGRSPRPFANWAAENAAAFK